MTKYSDEDRALIAIHEAGHAVIGVRFGWPLRYVTLKARAEGAHAQAKYADREVATTTWDMMAGAAAGALAQDIASGCLDRQWITEGSEPDFEEIRELARFTRDAWRGGRARPSRGLSKRATVRQIAAAAWIDTHRMVTADWGAILAVAEALLRSRRALTGRQVRGLVHAADTVATPAHAHMAADFWPAWFMPGGWWGTQLRTPAASAGGVQLTVGAAG